MFVAPVILLACHPDGREPTPPSSSSTDEPTAPTGPPTTAPVDTGHPDASVVIAAIGDYGSNPTAGAADVAALVEEWSVDLVVTLGDNNYPVGSAATIDESIGRNWSGWIAPYAGTLGTGATENRFFPALGNHDWMTADAQPYLDWFELPGNERYYVVERGPVDLFCLDSDPHEPDGVLPSSAQAAWLRQALASSDADFRVVYFHHPPYSSGFHGDAKWMQWPFAAWGVDLVLSGHDHDYQRLAIDGVDLVVNGLGGAGLRSLGEPHAGAQLGWDAEHGATFLLVDDEGLVRLETRATDGTVVERARLHRSRPAAPEWPLLAFGSDWTRWDAATLPPAEWVEPTFDDAAWPVGGAPLGYGTPRIVTPVDPGPDPLDRRPAAWFRTTFPVSDLAAIDDARMELRVEDGFVAWLNGQPLTRGNLAPGPVAPDDLALAEGSAEVTRSFVVDPSLLVAGPNVLAIELHHSAPGDAELSLDASLVAVRTARLVGADATWRYLDDGLGPDDEAWRSEVFDDSAWASGPAPLGFGGDVSTTIASSPDGHHLATWYRTTFDATAVPESLLLRTAADDGVVAWLNGVEVYRARLPASPPTPVTAAGPAPTSAGWDQAMAATFVDPELLRLGPNVLAVQVHLSDAGAASSRFAAELIALP